MIMADFLKNKVNMVGTHEPQVIAQLSKILNNY